MILDTTTFLLAASVFSTALAAPQPVSEPVSVVKRTPGGAFSRFGSCPLPKGGIEVRQPYYPTPDIFRDYTGPLRISSSSPESRRNGYTFLNGIQRYYYASFDERNPGRGLQLVGPIESPDDFQRDSRGKQIGSRRYRNPDNVDWIEQRIIFNLVDDGRGKIRWQRGGRDRVDVNFRIDINSAWESGYLDRFLISQWDSRGDERSPRSQYCIDFHDKFLKKDLGPIRDLWAGTPGFDRERGSGHGGFIGMDYYLNDAKGIILNRGWDRDDVRIERDWRARDLINFMERINIAFEFMRNRVFIDIFIRTNIRVHGEFVRIDDRIKVAIDGKRDIGRVRNNYASNYERFIRDELRESESAAWRWYQRALQRLRERIDIEIRANDIRLDIRINIEERYKRLRSKRIDDFRFDQYMYWF